MKEAQSSFSLLGKNSDSNRLQPAGQTHTSPIGVTSGHLWYNSRLILRVRSAPHTQGLTSYQNAQAPPALGLISGSPHILTTSSVHSRKTLHHSLKTTSNGLWSKSFYRQSVRRCRDIPSDQVSRCKPYR
jgi:hypothetical protein